jgi:hypothetical protein
VFGELLAEVNSSSVITWFCLDVVAVRTCQNLTSHQFNLGLTYMVIQPFTTELFLVDFFERVARLPKLQLAITFDQALTSQSDEPVHLRASPLLLNLLISEISSPNQWHCIYCSCRSEQLLVRTWQLSAILRDSAPQINLSKY